MATLNIPTYPCDKNLFPCNYEDAQEWREDTTFFNDFKIAEAFGINAVKDTFNRSFNGWKGSAKYLCELTVVTNHLLWMAYEKSNEPLARFYNECYFKCRDYIFQADEDGNNSGPFSDDECSMIYRVLD